MGRKIEPNKSIGGTEDNFYKYNPKCEAVSYSAPKYTFSQTSSKGFGGKENQLGPGSYNMYFDEKNGWAYTIPRKQRFGPLIKERKLEKNLGLEDPFSTIGNLPSYIRRSIAKDKAARMMKKTKNKEEK